MLQKGMEVLLEKENDKRLRYQVGHIAIACLFFAGLGGAIFGSAGALPFIVPFFICLWLTQKMERSPLDED